MITVYQELIPLSNKMYEKPISQDSKYTSPVIVPFVYNSVGTENIMETVLYIRNDSQEYYYKDVVVSLMKASGNNPANSSGTVTFNGANAVLSLNAASGANVIPLDTAYPYSQTPTSPIILTNKYKNTYIPITEDSNVSVKFSYGYDELSFSEWSNKKSAILIPSIGTSGMANLSYTPIRMRMTWKGTPSAFTIRDYFIDVSYSNEVII